MNSSPKLNKYYKKRLTRIKRYIYKSNTDKRLKMMDYRTLDRNVSFCNYSNLYYHVAKRVLTISKLLLSYRQIELIKPEDHAQLICSSNEPVSFNRTFTGFKTCLRSPLTSLIKCVCAFFAVIYLNIL